MGIFLGILVGFFEILVVSDGSTNVKGKLGADDMVNGISKGVKVVKEDNLMMFERGAGVIDWDNLQDAIMNRVIFFKGHILLHTDFAYCCKQLSLKYATHRLSFSRVYSE
jgi:hypothetical protein